MLGIAGTVGTETAVILAATGDDTSPTVIEDGAHIGGNATILPGVTIGFEAQVRPDTATVAARLEDAGAVEVFDVGPEVRP